MERTKWLFYFSFWISHFSRKYIFFRWLHILLHVKLFYFSANYTPNGANTMLNFFLLSLDFSLKSNIFHSFSLKNTSNWAKKQHFYSFFTDFGPFSRYFRPIPAHPVDFTADPGSSRGIKVFTSHTRAAGFFLNGA